MKYGFPLFILLAFSCQSSIEKESSTKPISPRAEIADVSSYTEIAPVDTLKSWEGIPEQSFGDTSIFDFNSFQLWLEGPISRFENSDTLILEEMPGNYLYQRKLELKLADSLYSVKSYLSVHKSLEQVYPYHASDTSGPPYSVWQEGQQKWQAWSDYKYLPLESGEFRFPMLNRGHNQDPPAEIVKALALRDTFIDFEGEMGGTQAEVLFLGKPAAYYIHKAIMKLELYRDGLLENEYYVLLLFSYGC